MVIEVLVYRPHWNTIDNVIIAMTRMHWDVFYVIMYAMTSIQSNSDYL